MVTTKSIAFSAQAVGALATFLIGFTAFGSAAALAQAPVRVEAAWVRTAVPGQHGTGGFMKLTASEGVQLVGVSTPVAGVAEVHEMKLDSGVMKMRALTMLDLPAGKTVELKPGGYHLMLMDLKRALPKDSVVPLKLVFRNAHGRQSQLELKVPVSASAPQPVGAQKP